jgi:hypothetical protein
MFVAEAPIDRINGALTVVAACSSQAAALCALRSSEREDKDAKEALYDKLSGVFWTLGFEKDVQLIGDSNT